MQKYQSTITATNGSVIRNVPVTVIKEDGSLAEIFMDREGQVQAPNPLVTDSRGVFYFYAKNGRYSLRTAADGVQITDADTVLLFDPDETASDGPIADAVRRAEDAAERAETALGDSGLQNMVQDAQNAAANAAQAVIDAHQAVASIDAALIEVSEAKEDAQAAAQTASAAASDAQAVKDSLLNYDGTLSATPEWSDVPAHEDSNLDAQTQALANRIEAIKNSDVTEFQLNEIGSVIRRLADKVSDIVSVMDFGAVGDGVTDDTEAFNRLTAWMRTQIAGSAALNASAGVVIPRGRYSVSSWDLTNLIGRQFTIHAAGAVLVANTPGVAVVDQLNSRWVRIHDLVVFSPESVMARCGIQNGPGQTGGTCGNNYFQNVFVVGYFDKAAYMNFGSETTQTVGCTFENRNTDPSAYSAILDGACIYWLPESLYRPVTRGYRTPISFSHNSSFGTQFRNAGTGSAVFISGASGFSFDPSNYVLSMNDSGFVVYCGTIIRSRGLNLSPQYENTQNASSGTTGIKYCIKIVGEATSSAIDMLTVNVGSVQAEEALIYDSRGGSSYLRLSGADIRTAGLHGDASGVFFKTDSTLSFDGTLMAVRGSQVNLGAFASFNGTLIIDDISTIGSMPADGTYVIQDRQGNIRVAGKTVDIRNNSSTAGQVVLGNNGASAIAIQGNTTFPQLRAVGDATDIDIQLTPKGAGLVRFGSFTNDANGGYITIKDVSGALRKLRVAP